MNILEMDIGRSVRIGPFIPISAADTVKTSITIPANAIKFIKNDGTVVPYGTAITTITNGYATVPIDGTVLDQPGQFLILCCVSACSVVCHEWLVVRRNIAQLFFNEFPLIELGSTNIDGLTIADHLDVDGELNIHNPNGSAVHISGELGIHIESWDEEAVLIESYHNQPRSDDEQIGTGYLSDFVYNGANSNMTSANDMENLAWVGNVCDWSGNTNGRTFIYNHDVADANVIGIRKAGTPAGTYKKILLEPRSAYATDWVVELFKYESETIINQLTVYTGLPEGTPEHPIGIDKDSATVCIRSMNPTDSSNHPAIVFQSQSRNNNAVVCDGGADAHDIVARELDWLNHEVDNGVTAGYALKLGAAMASGKFTYDTDGTMTLFDRHGDVIERLHVTPNGRNR